MNYDKYSFSVKETIRYSALWIAICACLAFFFYRSYIAFALFLCGFPLYAKYIKRIRIAKRKAELSDRFVDSIRSVSGNLESGNSVENAFAGAYRDMISLYGEKDPICAELRKIIRGLDNNCVLEELISDFAARSGVKEIRDFADIFAIGKRTGGSLREIMADYVTITKNKNEIRSELKIQIEAAAFEHRIMCVVPFGILLYVGGTNRGYFDGLYHNFTGIAFMTVCLAVYITAFLWGSKITEIKV